MAISRTLVSATAACMALLACWGCMTAGVAVGGLSSFHSESAAVDSLKAPGGFNIRSVDASEVELLVRRGWHSVVREYVLLSHADGEEQSRRASTQVRQAVQSERNKLDDLIRVLDPTYGNVAEVTPASQWAQNSTHVFLAIKFAQRWNAPGALEVENETVSITECCFNFTAYGEHSFIRRRYHLSIELHRAVLPKASSWSWAAAGRMTVTFAKTDAAKWSGLSRAVEHSPKNVGVWRDMQEKWDRELNKFAKSAGTGKKGATATKADDPRLSKKGRADYRKVEVASRRAEVDEDTGDADDAIEREDELVSGCPKSSYSGSAVAELCEKGWGEVVEQPRVKGRRWLVQFYSSQGDGNAQSMKRLMPVWRRLADVFPSMTPHGRVGALDCGLHKILCGKLGLSLASLPQIWRFSNAKHKTWGGSMEASIEDLGAFGGQSADERPAGVEL